MELKLSCPDELQHAQPVLIVPFMELKLNLLVLGGDEGTAS